MSDPLAPPRLWDDRMLVKTINCSVGAHRGCPEGNNEMRCVCDCHKDPR